jgi:ribosomal protein S18 acetylase RimI-like enzyme
MPKAYYRGEFKMCEKILNSYICLKEYISEKECDEIHELEKLCNSKDNVNLKLELDYRLNIAKNSKAQINEINEFLYYIDGVLVAYLNISSFSRNIGEVNGMTHPKWRRKGIFRKLFELAMEQCKKRNFSKVVLLTDGNSSSGIAFINAVKGEYDFSEYRMELVNHTSAESSKSISLRLAEQSDKKEICRQNAIFFKGEVSQENAQKDAQEEEEEVAFPNQECYMIELGKEIIGKIKVDYDEDYAFICGFGILPNYRGKGYGKSALKETLKLISGRNISKVELDVECKNINALNLYKGCGFKEKSVMNYYKYSV